MSPSPSNWRFPNAKSKEKTLSLHKGGSPGGKEVRQEDRQGNEEDQKEKGLLMAKKGLYANIHAKRKRIKAGSGEKMRKPGSKGAPTAAAFKKSAKTAKKRKRK